MNQILQSNLFIYVAGTVWMVAVGWATIITIFSKKLSVMEKIVICFAIILSFYLAAFVEDEYYREIYLNPDPEYAFGRGRN